VICASFSIASVSGSSPDRFSNKSIFSSILFTTESARYHKGSVCLQFGSFQWISLKMYFLSQSFSPSSDSLSIIRGSYSDSSYCTSSSAHLCFHLSTFALIDRVRTAPPHQEMPLTMDDNYNNSLITARDIVVQHSD